MRALRLAAVLLLASAPAFAQYRTAVWIPGWDFTNVLNSLQLNAGKLSESNPVWYQINSDGTIAKSTSVAEDPTWRAAMTGTQILPTIQNTVNGSFNATVAINVISSANRDAHAEDIRQLVVNQAYDGIDIDYESLPLSARSDFTAFITALASKLHASGKKLSVTLYAKTSDGETWDGAGGEDYAAIGQQADWVKLMCYDYSWSTSPPGPMAPLSWIDQVVTYAQSVIPSAKIIVGLPWYGYDWGSTGTGITYQQAINTAIANNATISYDVNGEATYRYSNHTVYFQDANSYNRKTDLITQKHPNVGGFAAWRIAAEDPNIWTRVAALKGSTTPAAPAPPSSPTSLGATTMSASAIALTWADSSTNEDGFRVERCAGAGCTSFAQIAQLAANTTSFANSGLTASTSYTYRVVAYNGGGTSACSNNASATTQAPPPATNTTTLISARSVWKYLDNGSDQGAAWPSLSFDDSTWRSGAAQLGYGDGDEATIVGYGPDANNKYATTYFRQAFNIADASQYTSLKLRLVRDDGAVVYLNGTEVARPNMPAGTILYNTWAAIGAVGTDESTFFEYAVDPKLLVSGRNVLAVEIHQFDASSSDISFDAELTGTPATAPPPAPAAPSGLTATPSASSVALSWVDNATNEDGYRIERCSGIACTSFVQIAQLATNATTYSDASLAAPASYGYRVLAYNAGGTSAYSNIAAATTLAPAPLAAPTSLVATAISASQVALSWTDNSTTESGFDVERCTGGGCTSFAPIAQLAADATSYSDASLAANTSYTYRVRAFDSTSTSAYSNASTATTQAAAPPPAALAAPTNLTATATGPHSIQLAWTDNSAEETGFRIERCTGSKCIGFSLLTTAGANATSFTDSGLDRGTYYKYRVSAVNGSVSSSYSNTAGAQTPRT